MTRPFDRARYEALLEGLEATEKPFSLLERTARIDAEYFQHRYLRAAEIVANSETEPVTRLAYISDGNHFAISNEFEDSGVPYYRGQDVVGTFFVEQSTPVFINEKAFQEPHMTRSHLLKGDVLLSIVGTIGELSLVSSTNPATCSCKLAILRPRSISPEYLATFLRCEFGRSQIQRLTRGAVQMGLLLEDMDQISVIRLSPTFEKKISDVIQKARSGFEMAFEHTNAAEHNLVRALGLEGWRPPDPLTYTRRATEALAAKRLDAQFFSPRYSALRKVFKRGFEIVELGSIGEVLKGVTVPYHDKGTVPIIRSGDLADISEDAQFLRTLPSEPLFDLKRGDVLISSIGFGSIGKVQVFDKPGRYGTVSEVSVVRQNQLNPYYLGSFLRSFAGQMQIERFITGATGQLHLYPRDVARIFVPLLSDTKQTEFQQFAEHAHAARRGARALLDRAKRAVEVAIEESEAAALALLNTNEGF